MHSKRYIKFTILIYTVLCSINGYSSIPELKKNNSFHPPLNIPLVLSGNFGEIRANHFHSGIDIRTNGQTGLNVYSIEDGYVSRIYVNSSGYGRAIYITHPNGVTSVYGHLENFSPKIQETVLRLHYQKESFSLNEFFLKDELPIRKGEIIGKSGNAGSSGGPHLHFELRDSETEDILDPLLFGFKIQDSTSPQITRIRIFPIDNGGLIDGKAEAVSFSTVFYGNSYHLKNNPSITAWGNIGVGVESVDYQNNNWAKCGISNLKLLVDDVIIYEHRMDEFSFSESRYINTFIDYELYKTYSRKYIRAFKAEPNNPLSIYKKLENNGIISINDEVGKNIQLVVTDSYGNASKCSFTVSGKMQALPKRGNSSTDHFLKWNEPNTLKFNDIEISIPEKALYSNISFQFEEIPSNNFLSPIYKIHNEQTALQSAINISISLKKQVKNADKVYVSNVFNGRAWYALSTHREANIYTASTRSFGDYALAIDTIAPTIRSLDLTPNKRISGYKNLRFDISDENSGIKDYRGEIDGKWVMFEQTRPNSMPTYTFDASRITKNAKHHIVFIATDLCGNESRYECDFYW